MPAQQPSLRYDVFVAPESPFTAPPPRVGDLPAWDPKTSTLIFGARDAVLVDALTTVREATALADWVALHDRRLTTIYITHGHGDHWLGLAVLIDRFPDARAVATAKTVELMRTGLRGEASFRALFPGQIAEKVAMAEPLSQDHLELEGPPDHRLPRLMRRTNVPGTPPSADVTVACIYDRPASMTLLRHMSQPAPPVSNPVQPAVSYDGSGGSVADELRKLAELRNAGVLTDAEFAAQKSRLLGS